MKSKIQKWGNSLAVRIPNPFVKETGMVYGADVDISVENGKIIVTLQAVYEYTLDGLLNGVREDNLHTEIDTSDAVGREIW
ncbi:MAG: AbrB/MazE/SpoVT family DNA-binding domain-containing protein [Bacteroidota bacterium]